MSTPAKEEDTNQTRRDDDIPAVADTATDTNLSAANLRNDIRNTNPTNSSSAGQQPGQQQDSALEIRRLEMDANEKRERARRTTRILIGVTAVVASIYGLYMFYSLIKRRRDEKLNTPPDARVALPPPAPFSGDDGSPPADRNPYDVYPCPIPWHSSISEWSQHDGDINEGANTFLSLHTVPVFDEQVLLGAAVGGSARRGDGPIIIPTTPVRPTEFVAPPPIDLPATPKPSTKTPPTTAPGTNTDPPPTTEGPIVLTVEEIEKYINKRDPMTLVDLGSHYCVDGANARYIPGMLPSTVVDPSKDKEEEEEKEKEKEKEQADSETEAPPDVPPGTTPETPPDVLPEPSPESPPEPSYVDVPKGYCIQRCDYAQKNQADKSDFQVDDPEPGEQFNVSRDAQGRFRVQYELVLWMNPFGRNQNGFRWYCRALPNKAYDGVGWLPNADGFYLRKAISPLFLNSQLDIFQSSDRLDSLWSNGNKGYPQDTKRYPYTFYHRPPSTNDDAAKAMYHRICAGLPGSWIGDERTGNRPGGRSDKPTKVKMGYNNDKWHYSTYQMIGSYCYNVGFDDGHGTIASTAAGGNGHGDFRKLKINKTECERYRYVTPDKKPDGQFQSYPMQVTPGGLQCYACPNIYDYDEAHERNDETNTWTGHIYPSSTQLWGSMQDGFKCVRPCPAEFQPSKSSVNGYMCIPNAVPMKERLPYARIRVPTNTTTTR